MSAQDDETLNAAVDDVTSEALDLLGVEDAPAVADPQPTRRRRSGRSGTSGAERARRAKSAGKDGAAPGVKAAPRPRATRTPRVDIARSMAGLYTMAGVGVSVAPMLDPAVRVAVGTTMAEQAQACGEAWAVLAKENERVRRALESLLTVSSVGVLLAAHLPIVLAGVQASQAGRQLGEPVAA